MTYIIAPLVGAHFYPPATGILRALPQGTPFRLQPEPENPYDSKAIKVFVSVEDIAKQLTPAAIDIALAGTGLEWGDIEGQFELCLGHIADSDGRVLAKARASEPELAGNREFAGYAKAEFWFTTAGGWALRGNAEGNAEGNA